MKMDGEDRGLFQAIVQEMSLMSETNPDVKKRCADIHLHLDQASIRESAEKLRLVNFI